MRPRIDEQRVHNDLRGDEQTFPGYRIVLDWSEDYPPGAEQRMHRANRPALPPGRFWNSTSWDTMERVYRSGFDIAEDIERVWWSKYRVKLLRPADLSVTVEPLGNDVWCASWFSH